ncbi:MAG: hypothetical protein OXG25_10085 [Gammaproteobacteria bacterium]|nr:hypothetical protein [Gammaproteobacteria bacterium]
MAIEAKPIVWETLRPDEIANLPQRVRDNNESSTQVEDTWVVLRTAYPELSNILEHLQRLFRISSQAATQETIEQNLDRALDWLVTVGIGVESKIAIDNLEWRSRYMNETPLLTTSDIHVMSGMRSKNTSEPASRWKAEGKTLGIRVQGRDFYPDFQFEDGSPRPIMKRILEALPDHLTAWQKVAWFASGNGWLDGAAPQDCLEEGDSVVAAARQLADPARG